MEPKRLANNGWVHVTPGLVSESGGRGWGAIEIEFVFFGGMLVRRFKCGKVVVNIRIRNNL